MQQIKDHVSMNGAAEWIQMRQHKVTKEKQKSLIVVCFVSLIVPGVQLMLVQPFANDAGHLHNVG